MLIGQAEDNMAMNNTLNPITGGPDSLNMFVGAITLIEGSGIVIYPNITQSSMIFLANQSSSIEPNFIAIRDIVIGKSFTIVSSNAADKSVIAYLIIEGI